MRIVLVTRRYPPLIGGAERVLSYLGPALAAAGQDVTVLTARMDRKLPRVERADVDGAGSFRIERLATSRVRFVGTWLYVRALARWFARNRVDLAYVSMLKHDAFAVLGAAAWQGFPVVLRPEGAGATGDIAWQSWGRGGRTIARRCHRASALVAISPAVRAELEADGYLAAQIHDLPNGVPVPPERWTRPTALGDSLRAAYVGRLAPEKGADLLVEAWPTVLTQIPDAHLVLIGDGPERTRLKHRIDALGLRGSITLAGSMADPSAELRRCSLFVLPSREEGMSIALLEAMALGMPIVASEIPGNRALIEPGLEGRLAPPGDPLGLAQAIIAQHHDPTAPAQAAMARVRVENSYSIAAVACRHLALFNGLINVRS